MEVHTVSILEWRVESAALAARRIMRGWTDMGVDASEIREMSRISQKVSTSEDVEQ